MNRNRITSASLLCSSVALAGCVLLDRMKEKEQVFAFPHAVHAEEGLECLDCHTQVEEADDPGLPTQRQCSLCHADLDAEKPDERRIDVLFSDKRFLATGRTALADEVVFSHRAHANGRYDCTACHAGIAENAWVGELPRVSMDDCMRCHAEAGAPNECATCHSEIGTDWRPESHFQGWTQRHGQVFRGASSDLQARCSLCHTESSCNTCHMEVAPENHTNFWRRRGHVAEARMNRQNCEACHRSDFCSRCHEEVLPMSHRGSWGGTQSTHCLTCHFPLRAEGCITCHKGAPSHLEATPLPTDPTHSPGLDCRQCHGITAPLPHVDKGDECILCHR